MPSEIQHSENSFSSSAAPLISEISSKRDRGYLHYCGEGGFEYCYSGTIPRTLVLHNSVRGGGIPICDAKEVTFASFRNKQSKP